MSAVFKREFDDEGLEMPVREVVSRAMLCAMLDLDENEPLHIFNSECVEEACLLILDAEFTPKKAGDYIIKLESEVLKEQKAIAEAQAPTKNFAEDDFGKFDSLEEKYSKEVIVPVNVYYHSLYELLPEDTPTAENSFAVLKRRNCRKQFALQKEQIISKKMICQFFTLNENMKYYILTPSGKVVKEFSEKTSFMEDINNTFLPPAPGVYILMSEGQLASKREYDQAGESQKKSLLKADDWRQFINICQKRLSYESFCRLSIAGRAMLPSLQIMYPKKESPLFLNVVTNPWIPSDFRLVMCRKYSGVTDPKAEIQPFHLGDLLPFVLQGIVVQGDIDNCDRRECLLKGCQAVQLQNLTYKTFISHFNPMSIAAEMMTILKPKRAEIWLCRIDNRREVLRWFDDELTGEDWPFESATEEVKIVTLTPRYLEDMQRSGCLFPFLSRVKIFEAVIVCPLKSSITSTFFQEFQKGVYLGKLRMVRFVVRGCLRSTILGRAKTTFEYEYGEEVEWQNSQGLEFGTRIRAGIMDENAEQMAILEIRPYFVYSVVSVVFTSASSYQGELEKIYKEIDGLQKTVDLFFKN